jgi:UDP-2-acetamido-3-amino-2,3-dideoxy-glucuronate N-acetyltransferase
MLGVVGAGYWGKNLVRNFDALDALHTVCDHHAEIKERYPDFHTTQDFDELLAQEAITAIAISTPGHTHFELAVQALESGRDLFVEKPLCLSVAEGEQLVALAEERGRVLMVGHILQYHPAVEQLQQLVRDGELGDIHYLSAHRLNLGKICFHENALWAYAPHDISLILSLTGAQPTRVRCSGGAYLSEGIADQTATTLEFASGATGHILSSWMHPFKEHKFTVIGSKGAAVFDDTRGWSEKLALYRQPVQWADGVPTVVPVEPEFQMLEEKEPLREECAHFLRCCQERRVPRTDGAEGVRVLQVLEAAQRSLTPARTTYVARNSVSV